MFHLSRKEVVPEVRVGYGAHSEVWKGKWTSKGGEIPVAIKKVSTNGVLESDIIHLLDEIKILSYIRHQNILHVYGSFFVKNKLWIITEFIEGSNMHELLHDDATEIPWGTRLSWAYQAAVAVCAIHSHDPIILHRDIKSLNFMVTTDGSTVKLVDFGFAKFAAVISAVPGASATLRWGAPETLVFSPKWSSKSDVYSLGCTFFEIASRQIPYPEADDERAALAAKDTSRPAIPQDCPDKFAKTISECWDLDPHVRPTSIELVERLHCLVPERQDATEDLCCLNEPKKRKNYCMLSKLLSSTKLVANMPRYHKFLIRNFGKPLTRMLLGKSPKMKQAEKRNTSFNLTSDTAVSLFSNASVEFRRNQCWVRVTSPELHLGPDTCMFESSQLGMLKSRETEAGISVVDSMLHQFFVPPASNQFTLRFQMEGIQRHEFDQAKCQLSLFNQSQKAFLIYKKPFLIDSNGKKESNTFSWNTASNTLIVPIPDNISPPFVLYFDISGAGTPSG